MQTQKSNFWSKTQDLPEAFSLLSSGQMSTSESILGDRVSSQLPSTTWMRRATYSLKLLNHPQPKPRMLTRQQIPSSQKVKPGGSSYLCAAAMAQGLQPWALAQLQHHSSDHVLELCYCLSRTTYLAYEMWFFSITDAIPFVSYLEQTILFHTQGYHPLGKCTA